MACILTNGRKRACYDSVAGIKAVYFADYGTMGVVTMAADDSITDLDGASLTWFQYDIKGSASTYTETITKGVDAGTAFFAQSLAITLPKLTKEAHKEIKLLVYGSPHVCIEDYNGNFFLMGLISGADVNGGTIVSGGARGDLSGYTLTMTGEEALPANFVLPDLATVLTGVSATISASQETP